MKLKRKITVLGFILPALIPLCVFWIYPICKAIWISFTDWDFMSTSIHFKGLENYMAVLKDPRFYEALRNTVIFTAGTLIPTICLGLHWLFQENFMAQKY